MREVKKTKTTCFIILGLIHIKKHEGDKPAKIYGRRMRQPKDLIGVVLKPNNKILKFINSHDTDNVYKELYAFNCYTK